MHDTLYTGTVIPGKLEKGKPPGIETDVEVVAFLLEIRKWGIYYEKR
jgi:hypothetical protein